MRTQLFTVLSWLEPRNNGSRNVISLVSTKSMIDHLQYGAMLVHVVHTGV